MWQLAAFGAALCFFHLSEFALAAVYMRDQLSLKCECTFALAAYHKYIRICHTHCLSPCFSTARECLPVHTRHPARGMHPPARCTAKTALQILTKPSKNLINAALRTAFLFSWPYTAAMAAGVTEFILEAQWWPSLKQHQLISYTGLALIITGEALRKLAVVSSPDSVADSALASMHESTSPDTPVHQECRRWTCRLAPICAFKAN